MIGFFLRRPVTLLSVYIIILVLGIVSLSRLPIELYPEVSYPKLNITIDWLGASPEAIEKGITRKVEAAIFKLKGVVDVSSTSERNRCDIECEFERNIDMDYQKMLLNEALSQIELPSDARAPVITEARPEEFKQGVPFILSLSGPYSRKRMAEIAEDVKTVLERIEGVRSVVLYGDEKTVLNIEVTNPLISIYDIVSVLLKRDEAAGEYRVDGRNVAVILKNHPALDDVLINELALHRVATCEFSTVPPYVLSSVNGNPVITLNIEKRRDEGLLDVSRRVKGTLKSIQLPPDVHIEFSRDEADQIRTTMHKICILGIISILGVSLCFLLMMRTKSSVFIFFLTILFSSLLTLILLYFSRLSLNLMTISGIALGFGLIVDNSIIVMENILRHKEEKIAKPEEKGAREVFLPVLAATLTTICVFIPFLFLQEKLRLFYVQFALSASYALFSSIFVSFSLTPFLATRLKSVISHTHTRYRAILKAFIRARYAVLVVVLLLIGGGYYVFDYYVHKGKIWTFKVDNKLYVQIQLPSGSKTCEVLNIVEKFERGIKEYPIEKNFYTRVHSRYAWIEIDLEKIDERVFLLKEELETLATQFAHCRIYVYGIGPMFYTGTSIVGFPVMSLSGYDYDRMEVIAEGIKQKLEENRRVHDVDVNFSWQGKQKEFMLSPSQYLSRYGFVPSLVSMNLMQEITFPWFMENKSISVRVLKDTILSRHELERIPVAEGVELRDVAILTEELSAAEIARENQEYRKDISFDFDGSAKMFCNYVETFLNAINLPDGFTLTRYSFFGSEEEELKTREIIISICLALFLLTAILSSLYESLAKPLLILLVLPFSFIGVSLIYAITEINFDTSAFVGLILLFGIAVNDGIVLIHHLSRGKTQTIEEIIKRAADRFRPIIITTLTTLAGLLPFAIAKSDILIFSKLALSCIGGLIFSTIGSLFVLPVVYYSFFRRKSKKDCN